MKPIEKELRQALHDKYMTYDKEKLVEFVVDFIMIYAKRYCLPSDSVSSTRSMIDDIQQTTGSH